MEWCGAVVIVVDDMRGVLEKFQDFEFWLFCRAGTSRWLFGRIPKIETLAK